MKDRHAREAKRQIKILFWMAVSVAIGMFIFMSIYNLIT